MHSKDTHCSGTGCGTVWSNFSSLVAVKGLVLGSYVASYITGSIASYWQTSSEISGMAGREVVLALLVCVICCCGRAAALIEPLTISNEAGTQVQITENAEVLDYPGYVTAESYGETVWFAYIRENYDDLMDHDQYPALLFYSRETLTDDIKSAQGFDYTGASEVILFPHYYWRGEGVSLKDSNPDITDLFPPGDIHGLSSALVVGGAWEFYTEINYGGQKVELDNFAIPEEFNDSIKSIKLL